MARFYGVFVQPTLFGAVALWSATGDGSACWDGSGLKLSTTCRRSNVPVRIVR